MSGLTVEMPVSVGTLIDRIAILELKLARMEGAQALAGIRREHAVLIARRDAALTPSPALDALTREIEGVNRLLWDTEETVRALARRGDFGAGFVAAARVIYRTNDERARIKARIDALTGSAFAERKSYLRED